MTLVQMDTASFAAFVGGGAFLFALALTPFIARIARERGVVDAPGDQRKIHTRAMPLLGGWALYLAAACVLIPLLIFSTRLTGGEVTFTHYLGFLLGGLVLVIVGSLDDRFTLPPHVTILAPVAAALIAVLSGTEVEKLTNPFGGVLYLSQAVSNVLVFVWLLTVMYTTKMLDGLDGLSTSISSIGAFMVLLLTLTTAYFQPDVSVFSAVILGSFLGFLVWNSHPASIFLGEGGSTFVGYSVGMLAVISGGKLATALLVLGIPLLDVAWVVLRRLRIGGLKQVVKGDRKHLHHRLLDLGWTQRRIVFAYSAFAVLFGGSALFLQSREKLIALFLLGVFMLATAMALVHQEYARPRS